MNPMTLKNIWMLSSLLLAGCILPPKETAHPAPLQSGAVGLSGAAIEPAPDGWWRSFDDAQLDRLIGAGLKDSPRLAEAQARVADARARAQAAESKRLPSANLDANA